MKTVFVTGPVGSGKSRVCALLSARGIPVYDSDSRTKALYRRQTLVARLEKALGRPLRDDGGALDKKRLASLIFSDPSARESLEAVVYPLVRADFLRWRARQKAPFVVMESAVVLSKPVFDGLADAVILVTAPAPLRLERVIARSGLSREEVLLRMAAQEDAFPPEKVHFVIENTAGEKELSEAVDNAFEKLEKFLTL